MISERLLCHRLRVFPRCNVSSLVAGNDGSRRFTECACTGPTVGERPVEGIGMAEREGAGVATPDCLRELFGRQTSLQTC